jgi:hypothetical protein
LGTSFLVVNEESFGEVRARGATASSTTNFAPLPSPTLANVKPGVNVILARDLFHLLTVGSWDAEREADADDARVMLAQVQL